MDSSLHNDDAPRAASQPPPARELLAHRLARPTLWLVLLLIAVAGYRLTLIDSGHFFWGDEVRYRYAEAMTDALLEGDFRNAAAQPFQSDVFGRPGFVLIGVIPALAQRAVGSLLSIERDTLAYYDAVSVFNVLVSLAVLLCLFRLGHLWSGSPWYALLMAGVYSGLCSANVWIRHLMPYNLSLLVFLLGLLVVSSKCTSRNRGFGRGVVVGALSAFAYACYPTYYAFCAVNAVVLLVVSPRRVLAASGFVMGSLGVVSALEALSRFGDTSYFDTAVYSVLAHLAQKSHGFFGEGYVYAWRFMCDVEGVIGVTLFILFGVFLTLVIWRRESRVTYAARAAIAAAVAGYLWHASMSTLMHKTIFFGRILGMYLPFMVAGAVLALMHIRRARARRLAVVGLVLASLVSFVSFARTYARLQYPADLFLATMAEQDVGVNFPPWTLWGFSGGEADSIEELDPRFALVMDARPEGTENPLLHLSTHEQTATCRAEFIGVNLKWTFYHRQEDTRYEPPAGYEEIARADSPWTFPASGYEAYKPWERRRLVQRRYTMRIYRRTIDVLGSVVTARDMLAESAAGRPASVR